LIFESDCNPHPQKRAYVMSILEYARISISLDSDIEERAIELEVHGFKPVDALHIASAEAGSVDYFCTCDDGILAKARQRVALLVKIRSPIDLAQEKFE